MAQRLAPGRPRPGAASMEEVRAAINDAFEYWIHKRSGMVYAVRLKDGSVTGTCGPLELNTVTARENPSALTYRDASWMDEHREEFSPLAEWLRGRF